MGMRNSTRLISNWNQFRGRRERDKFVTFTKSKTCWRVFDQKMFCLSVDVWLYAVSDVEFRNENNWIIFLLSPDAACLTCECLLAPGQDLLVSCSVCAFHKLYRWLGYPGSIFGNRMETSFSLSESSLLRISCICLNEFQNLFAEKHGFFVTKYHRDLEYTLRLWIGSLFWCNFFCFLNECINLFSKASLAMRIWIKKWDTIRTKPDSNSRIFEINISQCFLVKSLVICSAIWSQSTHLFITFEQRIY